MEAASETVYGSVKNAFYRGILALRNSTQTMSPGAALEELHQHVVEYRHGLVELDGHWIERISKLLLVLTGGQVTLLKKDQLCDIVFHQNLAKHISTQKDLGELVKADLRSILSSTRKLIDVYQAHEESDQRIRLLSLQLTNEQLEGERLSQELIKLAAHTEHEIGSRQAEVDKLRTLFDGLNERHAEQLLALQEKVAMLQRKLGYERDANKQLKGEHQELVEALGKAEERIERLSRRKVEAPQQPIVVQAPEGPTLNKLKRRIVELEKLNTQLEEENAWYKQERVHTLEAWERAQKVKRVADENLNAQFEELLDLKSELAKLFDHVDQMRPLLEQGGENPQAAFDALGRLYRDVSSLKARQTRE